ncbi:MAG: hypothetical protein INR71_05545 [Terriglobus roseus]|nr:hypothetical protein [Terriglobus roseus]
MSSSAADGDANSNVNGTSTNGAPRDSKGWDGKLRVEKRPVIANPEALSDPDYSDEDAPPVEQIEADEGGLVLSCGEGRQQMLTCE